MTTHNQSDLIKAGFTYAGITVKCDLIGYGQMRRIARYLNVTVASLRSFRTAIGRWAVYYSEVSAPYVDEAIFTNS